MCIRDRGFDLRVCARRVPAECVETRYNRGVTIGAAVQAMLVGMPAPRDLHRSEVDGQVFVAVGATVLFSYAADDAGLRNLAAVTLPEPVLTEPVLTEPMVAEPVLTEPVGTPVGPFTGSARVATGAGRCRYAG